MNCWPVTWDRGPFLGAIEEASGQSLHADDSLVDDLICCAQEMRLSPMELREWIYDDPESFSTEELTRWALRLKEFRAHKANDFMFCLQRLAAASLAPERGGYER
jgi:hypothetical protein